MLNLGIIIPCYNEAPNLELLYEELTQSLSTINISYKIIFINDGSADDTLGVIRKLMRKSGGNIVLVNLSRNFGYEPAVRAGLDMMCKYDPEYVIIMDADLQDPPQILGQLRDTIHQGYDIVLAKRQVRSDGLIKDTTAWLFYRLINVLSNVPIPKDVGYYRIFSRQVLGEVVKFEEYSLFLKGIFGYLGFTVSEVLYERPKRLQGSTKISFKGLMRLASRGIIAFSTVPLQWIMVIGLLCAGIAFAVGITQIILKFTSPESYQYGVSTVVTLVSFLTGIQLISLGILGIYMGKIYEETKRRPIYVIKSVE